MTHDPDSVLARRRLPDGRLLDVYPSGAGALLALCTPFDDLDGWEYEDQSSAIRACLAWDPDHDPNPPDAVRHLEDH